MFIREKKGFTLIELMIVVAIIGILAAIAIPNFLRFQARSRQSESQGNLKALFTAELSYFAQYNQVAGVCIVGYRPERGNRYCYALNIANALDQTAANPCVGVGAGLDLGWTVDTQKWPGALGGACPALAAAATIMDASALTPTQCQAGGSANTWTAAGAGCGSGFYGAAAPPYPAFCASATGQVDGDAFVDTWFIKGSGAEDLKGPMDGNPCQDGTMNDVGN